MKKEDILNSGILEQYVLGLLEEEEVAEVEEMLKEHPELWDYVRDLKVTMTAVSFQNGVKPPRSAGQVSDGGIIAGPVQTRKSSLRAALGWFSWILLIAMAGMNVYLASKYDRLQKEYAQLEHKYSSTSTKVSHLKEEHTVNEFLVDEKTRKQVITGEYQNRVYTSWIYLNEDLGKVYWQMGNLPELDRGQCYRIWANVNGEMISVGPPIRHHHDMLELKYIPNAESFHITMENKPSTDHPSIDHLIASGSSGITL